MPLNPGDKVLVKLSNKKQPEEDTYTVLDTHGTEVYARNDKSGQVLRRHLSRFTKIMEKPAQPPAPIQVDQADQGQSNDDLIPLSVIDNAQPPQPINLEPGTRQREEPREEPQNQPRRARFGRRARNRSFNAEDQVRTTRSKTAKSGVPVPEFKTTSATLEYNKRALETAKQMLDQYRIDTAAAARRANPQQPPQQPPRN